MGRCVQLGSRSTWNSVCSRWLLAATLVLLSPLVNAQTDSLKFFKNYFVTGDYAVAGVGLEGTGVNGFAQGNINMVGVPANADIVAAYLYWGTKENTSTASAGQGWFRGNKIVGLVIGNNSNPACWSSGGSVKNWGRVYRADVLRYLPVDANKNIRLANSSDPQVGPHIVKLPDSGGNGNGNVLYTEGASLVVIYREVLAGQPGAKPLRAVVIYDGSYTVGKGTAALTQVVSGFYQTAASPSARMTQLVGNGQGGFSSPLTVNGGAVSATPFTGNQGGRWDNATFNITLGANASSFSTQVTQGNSQFCGQWSAIIASMIVQDTDLDGLLDVWETSGLYAAPATATTPAVFGACSPTTRSTDPNCVDLPDMGALPNRKDIFVEVDWLTHPGLPGVAPHEHKPDPGAMSVVAAAFQAKGIALHLDLGPGAEYQGVPNRVPPALTRGGKITDLNETNLVCRDAQFTHCTFPNLNYAVFGWKVGFRGLKEGFPIMNVARHFDRNRKDIFRYSLFGHAVGLPDQVNPQVPRATSGVGDRYGADFMITLGLWRSDFPAYNQVGAPLVQAGTFMHELGHTLGLSHAGLYRAPNCVPNYPSVMNYLYQTRGLTSADGNSIRFDFSSGLGGSGFNEQALAEGVSPLDYRVRYFGPLAATDPPDSAAKRHCDGTPVAPGEPSSVRLENKTSYLDWNNNKTADGGTFSLDVNFDGTLGVSPGSGNGAWGNGSGPSGLFVDSNDWGNLNLQQISARMNVGGLSSDIGPNDLGQTDFGQTDFGQTDFGQTDFGQTDFGQTDFGQTDFGQTDFGQTDFGEQEYFDYVYASIEPPSGLTATNKVDRITLNWIPPFTGEIAEYRIYRTVGSGPRKLMKRIYRADLVNVGSPTTDIKIGDLGLDGVTTAYNTDYVLEVTSVFLLDKLQESPTYAGPVTGVIRRLYIDGSTTASIVFGTARPTGTALYTLRAGSRDASNVPANACVVDGQGQSDPLPIGTYTIVCGPSPVAVTDSIGENGIEYKNGTLQVTPIPVQVALTFTGRFYDRTTAATFQTCVVTGGRPQDTLGCTATGVFDSPNAGTRNIVVGPITLTGSNTANYFISNTPAPTAVISPKPVSPSVAIADKFYDRTTTAPFTCTAVGVITPDVVTCTGTGTFPSKNAGAYTANVTGLTLAGADKDNYSLSPTAASAAATIKPKPVTATVFVADKVYDGNTTASITCSVNDVISPDAVTCSGTGAFSSKNAATYTVSVTGITLAGADKDNYALTTPSGSATAKITPKPVSAAVTVSNKIYDGNTSATVNCSVPGKILNDALTCSGSAAFPSKNAATYTVGVTAITLAGLDKDNYSLSPTTGSATATIQPKPITVVANNVSKRYRATDPPLTYVATGLIPGDALSGTLTRAPGENRGTYPITKGSLSGLPNYTIQFTGATFTIRGDDD